MSQTTSAPVLCSERFCSCCTRATIRGDSIFWVHVHADTLYNSVQTSGRTGLGSNIATWNGICRWEHHKADYSLPCMACHFYKVSWAWQLDAIPWDRGKLSHNGGLTVKPWGWKVFRAAATCVALTVNPWELADLIRMVGLCCLHTLALFRLFLSG